MRTIGATPALIALLNGGADFVMADLYTLTLSGGTVVRWSGAAEAITVPATPSLLQNASDFAAATWTKDQGGTGTLPTVTPNYAGQADRVQFTKGTGFSRFYGTLTGGVSGTTYTMTVTMRSTSGSPISGPALRISGAANLNGTTLAVTGSDQEFTLSAVASTSGTIFFEVLLWVSIGGSPASADVIITEVYVQTGTVPNQRVPLTWGIGPLLDRGKITHKLGVEVSTLDVALTANPTDLINGSPVIPFIKGGGLDGATLKLERAFLPTWAPRQPNSVFPDPTFTLTGFGDSFTAGQNATSTPQTYLARVGASLDMPVVNRGQSGMGSFVATAEAFAYLPATSRISGLATWLATFNDVNRGNTAGVMPKTLRKIEGELRSLLSHCFAGTSQAALGGATSSTGTWAALGSSVLPKADRIGGSGALSFVIGSSRTYTFTGDSLVVRLYNSDGVALQLAAVEVKVDGNIVETYNGNGNTDGQPDFTYSNQATHEARVYTGFGPGAHTLVLTHAGPNGLAVYLDTVDTLQAPLDCVGVVLGTTPRQNAAGYVATGGSEAASAAADAVILAAAADWSGYPVAVANVAGFYNTTNGVSGDNIHPNDLGHLQISQAFRAAVGGPVARVVGKLIDFSGRITSVKNVTRSGAEITVSSETVLLNVNVPPDVYQSPCLNTLFDSKCGLSKAAFASTGSVSGGASVLSFNTGLAQATGYFDQGQIVFTSGPNNGLSRTVRTHVNASGKITLALPLPVAPGVGNTFTIYPGCDLTSPTCLSKFSNLIKFRGQPFVPPPETAV